MEKNGVFPDDQEFIHNQLFLLPHPFKERVISQYIERLSYKGRREANLSLIDLTERVDSAIAHRLNKGILNFDESDLKNLAKIKAKRCLEIWRSSRSQSIEIPYKNIVSFIRENGINVSPYKGNLSEIEIQLLIRKLCDYKWWLRKLRITQNRDIETIARQLNLVHKKGDIYISNLNHHRFLQQKIEQRKYLENMLAENEEGDQLLLSELHDSSPSNPHIKHSELMARFRGYENYANKHEHIGLFITMTCPSKYHRAYGISGDSNPKWDGSTPIDAQEYLKTTWSRIRASMDREDIRVYGFRIAEPHHDGTPHWHLLLFLNPEMKTAMENIFQHYCFEEDGDEYGADKNRLKIIDIDPTKGSATGYIVKYVSKNIDGRNLESGVYGEEPTLAAEKVTAWASVWGIRQFQQIGGATVTPYRELRRMTESAEKGSVLEEARLAADQSDWEAYQVAMGGVNLPRKDRPITVIYWNEINTVTGEIRPNQYGELKTPSIYGLGFDGNIYNTRPHLWKISKVNEVF